MKQETKVNKTTHEEKMKLLAEHWAVIAERCGGDIGTAITNRQEEDICEKLAVVQPSDDARLKQSLIRSWRGQFRPFLRTLNPPRCFVRDKKGMKTTICKLATHEETAEACIGRRESSLRYSKTRGTRDAQADGRASRIDDHLDRSIAKEHCDWLHKQVECGIESRAVIAQLQKKIAAYEELYGPKKPKAIR